MSCYTCHGREYGTDGSNVHNPLASVDESAPVTTSDAKPFYSETATITLTAVDNAGGWGVASTSYRVDGGAETTGTTIVVSAEGSHTIEFWSVDRADNVETPHQTATFVIDTVAPTTTSDAREFYSGPATITLEGQDTPGGSGIADTYYVLDGGAETTGTVVNVAAPGTHTLEFWSTDAAGNVESPRRTATFLIDTTAPTTSSDATATYENVAVITLSATDDSAGSGVASTHYALDGGAETTGTVTSVSGVGSHTLEFWSVDTAGNVEQRQTVTFAVLDTTAATTTSDVRPTYSDAATITLSAADTAGGSGVASTHYSLDQGAETTGTVIAVDRVGAHSLDFWSIDASGNVEPRRTVTFDIVDTIAPTTTSDAKTSYSNVATISLSASDTAGGSGVATTRYILDGGTATDGTEVVVSGIGTHTIEFWSTDSAGNVEPRQSVTFSIGDTIAPTTASDATSSYPNAATITLSATDNSGGTGVASTHYVLDGAAETTGTVVSVSTAGGHTLQYWSVDNAGNVEDRITVTFAIDDLVAPSTTSDAQFAYVNVAAIAFTALDNAGGSGIASTRYILDSDTEMVGDSVTVGTTGTHTLEFWSVDAAGNAESPHQLVTFTVSDAIAPTTTSDALPSYTDTALISLAATDNPGGSGVAATYYRLDGSSEPTAGASVSVSSAGSHTLEFWSVDAAGNAETPSSVTFVIGDSIAPTTVSDAGIAYVNTATISLTAADNTGGSGVASTYYRLDGASEATSGTTVVVSNAGSHTLEFWSVDAAGNAENPTTVGFAVTDAIAPTTTSNARAIYGDTASIELTATDNLGGVGVATTHYVVDDGLEATGTSVVVTGPGTHALRFWSVDAQGNVETATTVTFVVDPTAPTTTSDAQPTYLLPATIVLTATDNAGGSGVSATHYTVDGGAQQTGTQVMVSEDGPHTLEFWSVDEAGNVESHKTATFVIDSTAPTTSSDAQFAYENTATVQLTASDGSGTGVAETQYSLDGGPGTPGTSVTVAHRWQPHARVLVGRCGGQRRDAPQERRLHDQRHDRSRDDVRRGRRATRTPRRSRSPASITSAASGWARPTTSSTAPPRPPARS